MTISNYDGVWLNKSYIQVVRPHERPNTDDYVIEFLVGPDTFRGKTVYKTLTECETAIENMFKWEIE